MVFKVVVADPETGKSYPLEAREPDARRLVGIRIGDKFDGVASRHLRPRPNERPAGWRFWFFTSEARGAAPEAGPGFEDFRRNCAG